MNEQREAGGQALLLACARAQRVGAVAADIDWQAFEDLVSFHLLTSPVQGVLNDQPGAVPADTLSRIGAASQQVLKHNLLLTARLLQLIDDLSATGIPVLALKGPALAQYLYQDIGHRQSLDLDLLVASKDVQRAIAVLEHRGYTLRSGLGWLRPKTLVERRNELTFCGTCGTFVDLHWEISSDDRPFRIPTSRLWSSSSNVQIAGHDVPVLGPECLLVYLCIHGAGHCWSRLQWLCDVARLLTITERLNWDTVFELAAEARANHVLALGLSLAHDALGTELPPAVVQWVENDRVAPQIAQGVIQRLYSGRPTRPSSFELTMFNARLAETTWDGVRHIAALLKAPTEADAEIVRLPEAVLFLYYPFRVARLAARYGRSLLLPGGAA